MSVLDNDVQMEKYTARNTKVFKFELMLSLSRTEYHHSINCNSHMIFF